MQMQNAVFQLRHANDVLLQRIHSNVAARQVQKAGAEGVVGRIFDLGTVNAVLFYEKGEGSDCVAKPLRIPI